MSDILDQFPDAIDLFSTAKGPEGFGISFSKKGLGCGEIVFYNHNGKIICDNEYLNRDTIKGILNLMVDQCILTSEQPQEQLEGQPFEHGEEN